MGLHFGPEASEQAHKFTVGMADLKGELGGLALKMGSSVIPAFEHFVVALAATSPALKELGLRMLALSLPATGVGIFAAPALWKAADEQGKKALQAMTDFQDHLNKSVIGAKAATDAELGLSGAKKTHTDALAALISREQEQLAMLNANGNKVKELNIEHAHAVEEINKLVKAGGNFKEVLVAQGLELDLYIKKLMDVAAVFPKVGRDGWAQLIKQPALAVPVKLPFEFETPKLPSFESSTPAGIAASSREMDKTRQAEKAMRLEADLSSTSLMKLSEAFKGLTNSQIAASASGQHMIEQLSKLDQVGSFGQQFKSMTDSLITEGGNFGGNMLKIVGHSIDQIEDKFAEMVVKGRVNFRELGRSIEEEMVKASIQKGVSVGLSSIEKIFSGKGSTPKADGSQGSPFYVVMANKLGGLIGGATGEGIAKPLGAVAKVAGAAGGEGQGTEGTAGLAPVFSALESEFSKVGQVVASAVKGMGGIFGMIFGGMLAGGGDVRAGRLYGVGEKGRELFAPGVSGHVFPTGSSADAHQARPMVIHQHFHITTPDADSFRKSQSQVAGEMYRAMAMAHARSNS